MLCVGRSASTGTSTSLAGRDPDKIAPPVRVLLRLALYQILFLDRIPDHAAVNDTVDIAKTSQPPYVVRFINAILREAGRRGSDWNWPDQRKDRAVHMAVMTSHPVWLARRLIDEIGIEEAGLYFESNNRIAPAVFRVNTLKASREEVIGCLKLQQIESSPSPWLDMALRAKAVRRDMTGTAAFREGLLQAQDEASQMVSFLLAPMPGERVLDLCCGLGVKSAHIAILMKNEGEVLCVD